MPLLTRFDTPGGLRDLPTGHPRYEEWLGTWHKVINDMLGEGPFRGSAGPEPSPITARVGEFYNPSVTPVNPVGERSLVWMGFPRKIMLDHRDERHRAFELGDTRGDMPGGQSTQQEYLEWRITEGATPGEIKKVTFTTETPEYWGELFRFDPIRCAELYGELVGDTVLVNELVDAANNYDPLNKWNTTDGIVHYIVTNLPNTLGAAVGLARGSAQLTGSRHVRDNYEVSGGAETAADPRVGVDVNMLVRKGLSVTLREAIGLYMAAWDDTGWTKPDGSPVGDYWHVVRGRTGAALRIEYEVPASERANGTGFSVSDIKIGGRPITHGGHLAEHVTVMIGGVAGTHPA